MAINLGTTTKCINRTDIIDSLLRDIRKFPIITPEEEASLFEEYNKAKAEGNKEKMAHIKVQVINGNARFIYKMAKEYASQDNISDLFNEAYIGMDSCFDSFDVTSGNRFCSYASWYMRREINAFLINKNSIIKKSNQAKYGTKIKKIKNKFFTENGRYPIESELMDILNEEYGENVKNMSDLYDLQVNSINDTAPSDGDDREYNYEGHSNFSLHTATENEAIKEEESEYNKILVKALLESLKERDRDIVMLLFGLGCPDMSIADVAEKYGMTTERIRQIKNASLKKMKEVQANMAF